VVFGQELADGTFDDAAEVAAMLKSPRKIGHRMQRDGYLLHKRPDGERWVFRAEGKIFRSRLAFVKSNILSSAAEAARMIDERGKALAAGLGGKNDPENPKMPMSPILPRIHN
jgi:hypothetical protein